ncbi:MAG: hypothetical protein H6Q89_5768 [Myxococcaceae bacterium]|nr:hypothetical protein [Myxococcaceae bacterium]
MHVLFTKLSDLRHRVEVVRADGTREKAELDTRSFLTHDFIHYAVEAISGMTWGFFGTLAAGAPLRQLNDREANATWDPDSQIGLAESIAGPMLSVMKGHSDAEALLTGLDGMFSATGKLRPAWVTSSTRSTANTTGCGPPGGRLPSRASWSSSGPTPS